MLYEYLQKEAEVLDTIEGKLVETVQKASVDGRKVPDKTVERLSSVRKEREQNKEALAYFQS